MIIVEHYCMLYFFFFFNDTATTEIYTLSLHDALPICRVACAHQVRVRARVRGHLRARHPRRAPLDRALPAAVEHARRSEEHTSELQSRQYLVCRLLLEKKKKIVKMKR